MKDILSFVIPVYNEEANIAELARQIWSVVEKNKLSKKTEMIFVDDGSTDNTLNVLQNLRQTYPAIKIISFRRNLGKAMALQQGFRKSQGTVIVTMDGDLQDDPQEIPRILQALDGYDLVVGWKKQRRDSASRRVLSKWFNLTVRTACGVRLHDLNSGFKAMRAEVASEIKIYGELHRFIPVLAAQRGFTVGEIAVNHRPRVNGKSKYGSERIFKGFFDFLTVVFLYRFGKRPMHYFGILGLLGISIGLILGIYLTMQHFQGYKIAQRPLLILCVSLIVAGLQVFNTGFIAEMLVNRQSQVEPQPIKYETD